MTKITRTQVDEIFEMNEGGQCIIDLFKLVFPNWDNIKHVGGYPIAGHELGNYLMSKAIDEGIGMSWMNCGFSTDTTGTIDSWEVNTSECHPTLVSINGVKA